MNPDVEELLNAVLGAETSEGRRAELLDRLDRDPELRRAVAAELRLRGLLQVARAGEPRWLRLEGELDPAMATPESSLEAAVLAEIARDRARSRRRRFSLVAGALAACAAVVAAVALWPRSGGPISPNADAAAPGPIAVLVGASGVRWADGSASPRPGDEVGPVALRFDAGRLALALVNGVALTVEGPAELELRSAAEVVCRRGRVRARVPRGAEGFTLRTPGAAVIDRGTEFAANVTADGRTEARVFRGAADVSLLDRTGRPTLLESLPAGSAVTIDPAAAAVREVPAGADEFAAFAPDPPPLPLGPDYRAALAAAKPWAHWRFESLAGGVVPGGPGRPNLLAAGGLAAATNAHSIGCAVFAPDAPGQMLRTDADWTPPRATGYAVEFWFLADSFQRATLLGMSDPPEPTRHTLLVELFNRPPGPIPVRCLVRGLDRWPTGMHGGLNLYAKRTYVPHRWHHVVAQRRGDRFQLFLDGDEVSGATDPGDGTGPMRLIFGRVLPEQLPRPIDLRHFTGRLAEIAVYDRTLSADEVRRHAAPARR